MEDPATTSALPLASLSEKHHEELLFLSLVHVHINIFTHNSFQKFITPQHSIQQVCFFH